MQLPIFQTPLKDLSLMETKWASIINPFISNPSLSSSIINNVSLKNGTTVINHLLGRKLQGWRLCRVRGPATIYDNQDKNQTPELTLVLISNAVVDVDIEVF